MSRARTAYLLVFCALFLALLMGCSRDPNVRKQKYFESGEKFFAESKYREAAIQYANAVQIDPRFAQAHYQLGQTYLRLGDPQRAFPELLRTVDLSPDNYRAHTDLANILVAARKPDGTAFPEYLKQAEPHLALLKERQPNNAETHEVWANYYSAQNNLVGAMSEMQQAISVDPSRSESYLALALFQLQAKLTDQAEINFKKAIDVDPKSMANRLALGGFYQSRNRLSDAESQFRQAIDTAPKDPAPREALVRLLMQEGKKDDIESFLRQTKKDLPDNPEGYRMLGDFYFAIGDIDKAVAEYSSVYSDHPKDLHAKKNYIQLLILKNRLEEATKLNDEILKSNKNDIEALVGRGQLQLRRNDPAGSIASLQLAIRNDSDYALAHYHLGLAYSQQHDNARAETEWREAVRLNPSLTDAQRAIAILEISRGDADAALQTAQQIINAQPYSADGFLIRAFAELARQKYADAQKDAEQAMLRAPSNPGPYVQLGTIQLAQKHFPEAEKFYQQALEKDPSSSEGLSGLMNTYVAQKQFDKAIAAANAQIAKSPNTSNFYDLLGTALYGGKQDYAGADAALRKAIDLDKGNLDAIEKLGKVQVKEGSADQALSLYQQSIKNNPREVRFYILAGELYEARENWDQAKAMYQQALSISPDHPLASNNLAYVLLEQGGNPDVALGMAQAARRGMPDSANAADTLGWAYYHKGVYQSAIGQFQEALRLNEKSGAPDDAVLHYHLGLAYQKANQIPQARQQLEKAVKLSPNNAEARKALSELHS
ncbi:MAG TPA: tetratricopeptide repeat protein [Candidatus Dormibacteraeota bacterium]|nr:tetratricopeptide repeat protein [Candidatus Dormibacteraeota bacterium]